MTDLRTHQPLQVTAHLDGGVAWANSWGIALDGLLAGQLHQQSNAAHHGDRLDRDDVDEDLTPVLQQEDPADLDLPLARCLAGDPTSTAAGGVWHWAATCAWPVDGHTLMPEVRWWSARPDHPHLEVLAADLPQNLREREGRYRARWMPLLVTVCSAVTWRAVGDLEQTQALLEPIAAIGKKRAAGHGHVLAWQVTPVDVDEWTAGHLHPDGTLGRPTPAGCLTDHQGLVDGGVGVAGLRPPYIHPARQTELHLPAETGLSAAQEPL